MSAAAPPPLPDPATVPHDSKQVDIFICLILTWLISASFVWARFYTKVAISHAKLSGSEWCLMGALIMSLATSVAQILEVEYGMGAHIWDLGPATLNLVGATEAQWISIITYALSLALTKVSVLLLFLAIFVQRWLRITTWAVFATVIVSSIWVFYVIFSACTPLEAFWDPSIKPATCHSQIYWLSNQYLQIVTDFLIFLLPFPIVWQLKMEPRQKWVLFGLFASGFFVCLISIIRVVILTPTLANAGTDVTYNSAPIFYWTAVEINTAIAVACSITLKPLVGRVFPRLLPPTQRSLHKPSEANRRSTGLYNATVSIGSGNGRRGLADDHIRVDRGFAMQVEDREDDVELGNLRKEYTRPFSSEGKVSESSERL